MSDKKEEKKEKVESKPDLMLDKAAAKMDEEDRKLKKQKDYMPEVKAAIPDIVAPVSKDSAALDEALTQLLAWEKKTRLASDSDSSKLLAQTMLKLCYDCKNWRALNDHITLLSKRRAQMVKVVKTIVIDAMQWVDTCPTDELKLELINTLRAVSDGKIFVELERAQLTMTLAKMKEKEGNVAEAADIMGEVAVETIGSMDLKERAEFLLEQLRLTLDKKDFLRAELLSKKINKRQFTKPEWQAIRLKYHKLMIRYNTFNDDNFEVCKSWVEIFRVCSSSVEAQGTASSLVKDGDWQEALKQAVFFLLLSPYDSEWSDMIQRIKQEKLLSQLPLVPFVRDLVEQFTTNELIPWPLQYKTAGKAALYEDKVKGDETFSGVDKGASRWTTLHKRTVQHNIRVAASCYTRITVKRLAHFLQLDVAETEKNLSELVSSKQLYAKIDRPEGIVLFEKSKQSNEILNDWGSSITQLLDLVESTCHLISKEQMTHAIVPSSSQPAASKMDVDA